LAISGDEHCYDAPDERGVMEAGAKFRSSWCIRRRSTRRRVQSSRFVRYRAFESARGAP